MGRYSVDAVIRLLSLLLERPRKKTELWRLSRLNYNSFVNHLNLLVERGLVAERDGYYTLTDRGLREAKEILEWLKRTFQ
jgi:hypothetical protein